MSTINPNDFRVVCYKPSQNLRVMISGVKDRADIHTYLSKQARHAYEALEESGFYHVSDRETYEIVTTTEEPLLTWEEFCGGKCPTITATPFEFCQMIIQDATAHQFYVFE